MRSALATRTVPAATHGSSSSALAAATAPRWRSSSSSDCEQSVAGSQHPESRRALIADALDGFVPVPEETRFVDEMRALLESPGDPLDRDHFQPGHFTASGVVLSSDRDSVLLIHHRRLDLWVQPGGHIDPPDPTPVAAAVREILEETGVVVDGPGTLLGVDVHPIPGARGEPDHQHFDLQYLFHATADALVPDLDEVNDARWTPLSDVADRVGDASVRRAVAKLI